ncbi:hypothetical protein S40293_04719 [Stachybotrys chartarum IBT 40293]|nr:hypothetical protein S40293_04719 [Stachybotrys chartarum IBT 40293]
MPIHVQRFRDIPDGLVSLVSSHLPYSIPLLRRLQFAKFHGATTEHARVVFASHSPWPQDASDPPSSFSVSYVDVSGGPETQMWLYSTMENGTAGGSVRTDSEEQLNAIVQEIVQLKIEFGRECVYPGHVLLGTLHSGVRAVLEKSGRIYPRDTGDYDKWLFKIEELPTAETPLPEDMVWGVASLQDCEVVVSRTNLPRKPESLVQYPNLVIKLTDGTPVAWAFLGEPSPSREWTVAWQY